MRLVVSLILGSCFVVGASVSAVGLESKYPVAAQFRRGMQAVRPCEQLIDIFSRYLQCTIDAIGPRGENSLVPLAYAAGVRHEEFIQRARNSDFFASSSASLIRKELKEMHTNMHTYCDLFLTDAECHEFELHMLRYPDEAETMPRKAPPTARGTPKVN